MRRGSSSDALRWGRKVSIEVQLIGRDIERDTRLLKALDIKAACQVDVVESALEFQRNQLTFDIDCRTAVEQQFDRRLRQGRMRRDNIGDQTR